VSTPSHASSPVAALVSSSARSGHAGVNTGLGETGGGEGLRFETRGTGFGATGGELGCKLVGELGGELVGELRGELGGERRGAVSDVTWLSSSSSEMPR
jgi:hypothetical protein